MAALNQNQNIWQNQNMPQRQALNIVTFTGGIAVLFDPASTPSDQREVLTELQNLNTTQTVRLPAFGQANQPQPNIMDYSNDGPGYVRACVTWFLQKKANEIDLSKCLDIQEVERVASSAHMQLSSLRSTLQQPQHAQRQPTYEDDNMERPASSQQPVRQGHGQQPRDTTVTERQPLGQRQPQM